MPQDFPMRPDALQAQPITPPVSPKTSLDVIERARRYLAHVEPAITGQHGDLHTFRICCRIVRGFALNDQEALTVLTEWNVRCQPPWTERELREKISGARRYGRETVGSFC